MPDEAYCDVLYSQCKSRRDIVNKRNEIMKNNSEIIEQSFYDKCADKGSNFACKNIASPFFDIVVTRLVNFAANKTADKAESWANENLPKFRSWTSNKYKDYFTKNS